jgi:hypothetical protein
MTSYLLFCFDNSETYIYVICTPFFLLMMLGQYFLFIFELNNIKTVHTEVHQIFCAFRFSFKIVMFIQFKKIVTFIFVCWNFIYMMLYVF